MLSVAACQRARTALILVVAAGAATPASAHVK